jgi:hypothetical protein
MYTQQILLGVAIPQIATITVTGGTLTTDGSYSIRSFTANGTLGISGGNLSVEYLVVAGGGCGGGDAVVSGGGGGGGAGGLLTGNTTLNANSYSVTVGAGGNLAGFVGNNGDNSVLHTFTAVGGGAGRGGINAGFSGGSGGAGGYDGGAGGAGTPGQGNNGGSNGGGGGGAGSAGTSGAAGNGLTLNITGSNVNYANGGLSTTHDQNTGGGGTKGLGTASGAAGRDGVVIVRYLTAGTN